MPWLRLSMEVACFCSSATARSIHQGLGPRLPWPHSRLISLWYIYMLTHSASELSGFTCTSSLTMNEKFQYRTRPPSAVLKIFEFIVSERVQVNPDNSRAMSALTFSLFKLNTLEAKIVKLWVSQSHGVMIVVYRIYTTAITPRYWRQGGCSVITQSHVVQINQSENRNSYSVWKLNNNKVLRYFFLGCHVNFKQKI